MSVAKRYRIRENLIKTNIIMKIKILFQSKKTGEYVFDVKQRGFSINLDGNNEDFIKNTRKMFSAVKKWFEIYLGECKQKKIRYNR